MGLAPSKIEDDKVLVLCQERKRFVREALDGRCALAASHCAYIYSLRETGSLLRKCFELKVLKESMLNVLTSILCSNHTNAREVIQDFENIDGVRRLQEEEGIPGLEEEGENSPTNDKGGDFAEPENDFDNPSTETLVQVFKNRNDVPVEIPAVNPVNVVQSSTDVLPTNGESKEPCPVVSNVVKDLNSCMKEVEILFLQACNSGKEVPKILEEDKIQFRPLLPEEIAHGSKPSSFLATLFSCCREDVTVPESPSQAEIKYLTWHRSVSSQLSPSRNPLGTSSGGDISTLVRLYALESKLYDEVKASRAICRRYDEKCKKLRHQESRGENQINIDFTRATVKDLHSRILVAVQKIDFISKNIENLRDKDLQPQLDELIGSLNRMWATMLACHQHQCTIIKLVCRSCNLKISLQSESQCQAALLLSVELRKLCSNFQNWMASHKAYLCSLNLWLHKCMKSLKRSKGSRKQNAVNVSLTGCAVLPIFTTCEIWIKLLDDLPTKGLEDAIEGLIADISHSIPHQDKIPNDGTGGEIPTSFAPADPQSSLLRFLEKLEAFSEISLQKYIDLQKSISAAKEIFWRKD